MSAVAGRQAGSNHAKKASTQASKCTIFEPLSRGVATSVKPMLPHFAPPLSRSQPTCNQQTCSWN